MIFIELLQTIFWFNPLFILYKKAIQLNHEYLADDAVIKHCDDIPAYQYLLLDKSLLRNHIVLSSPFNYSVTKKRLVMMTKKYDQQSVLFKKLCMIPLFALVILVFSTRQIIAQQTKEPVKNAAVQPGKKAIQPVEPYALPDDMPIISTTGVSEDQLKEFNLIVDKTVTKQDNNVTTAGGHHVNTQKLLSKELPNNETGCLLFISK